MGEFSEQPYHRKIYYNICLIFHAYMYVWVRERISYLPERICMELRKQRLQATTTPVYVTMLRKGQHWQNSQRDFAHFSDNVLDFGSCVRSWAFCVSDYRSITLGVIQVDPLWLIALFCWSTGMIWTLRIGLKCKSNLVPRAYKFTTNSTEKLMTSSRELD